MLQRPHLTFIGWTLLSLFHLQSGVAQNGSNPTTEINGIHFTLADGLRIESVASEPLIKWPIVADWDNQGRLVVAESAGVTKPIVEHNLTTPHKLIRLVDSNGDGKFDKRIVAAEELAFPEGVLCLGNDVLVAAPPLIWRLIDDDGDGVCERREVWFDGQTITGCANDLHGPYLGPDGWIYWCKGAFAAQTHDLVNGETLETSAAHIFRRRIEGGPIEPVMTGGMDNPVEVAFTPAGERFFTSTFLQHPGGGLRDGIAHAVYGGVYGKENSVLADHPRTGPLMPIMTQLGPAAPSGLACLQSDRLTPFTKHNQARVLVAALFNLQKVTAHQLVSEGASYRSIDRDLVVADRIDFHPTDVIEDADGSLLIIDTGGWYDLCCPTSRIDQKTASGGIYRIWSDRTDAAEFTRGPVTVSSDANDVSATVSQLFDQRPWVRRQSGLTLAETGDAAAESLAAILRDSDRSIDDRLTALWALSRSGDAVSIAIVTEQLVDPNPLILQAACHVVAIHLDANSRQAVEGLLKHPSLAVRRVAAEALGRIGHSESVAPLLTACDHAGDDRHLQHSLLYALIEISRNHPVDLLELADSDIQLRSVLLVLDRVGRSDQVDLDRYFTALASGDPKLRDVAAEVLATHPQWASESVDKIRQRYAQLAADDSAAADNLARLVIGWKNEPPTQQMIADWIDNAATAKPAQQLFLASRLSQFSPTSLPTDWVGGIATWLPASSERVQQALAESLARLQIQAANATELLEAMVMIARQANSVAPRLHVLAALPTGRDVDDASLEQEVVASFLSDDAALTPLASKVLQRVKLSDASSLVKALPQIPSQFLTTAIEAVHRANNEADQAEMLASLASLPAAKTLPPTYLTNLYQNSSKELREQAGRTAADLIRPAADVKETVDQMLGRLHSGDPVRGFQVFRSSKAACSACHRIGYVGHDVGPELTRIGASRTPDALLEAILFPSARQEQSYQGSRVLTTDGQIHNGLMKHRTPEAIELQVNAEQTVLIPTDEIEILQPSDVSVMPAGLAEQLTLEELSDLMAFLQSAK